MRHARVEKINVVYSNNGWNVRIVAKYNFLIPVWAPSLPAQPATSPSLTKSPLTITSCLTVHLDQAPSHYHHCSLQTPDITVARVEQCSAVLGWCARRCCGLLTDGARLLLPAPAAPSCAARPHQPAQLPQLAGCQLTQLIRGRGMPPQYLYYN